MRGGFHTDDNTIWQFAVNAGDGMGWDGSQIGVDWMRSGGGGVCRHHRTGGGLQWCRIHFISRVGVMLEGRGQVKIDMCEFID